ncbi:hypothetical protein [Edaphobacter bradus]|uniref:hypothetical protein n=1 Tax=Edaphobacter bradus TaxID=2259016 RepID=UPI0021E070BA|nr:hypothetical protein [Edaphobacter bradus]
MTEGVQSGLGGLVQATQVARETAVRRASNGINYAAYGDTHVDPKDLERMVEAVPTTITAALQRKHYYFVPLALRESRSSEPTLISPVYTPELSDQAICHRNVALGDAEGVFISTRLLGDRFALAFEFFINAGHAFVDAAGVPESFDQLAWAQAVADVRGETSQDAWESRNLALAPEARLGRVDGRLIVDEKARTSFLESSFSDAVAIYLLSLAIDFDYSELREREYPLLAPQALAERLRLIAKLFPPNPNYEFAIRYRRRA